MTALLAWKAPKATPIVCSDCRAPLTPEELEFFETMCERCEVKFCKILAGDIDAEP